MEKQMLINRLKEVVGSDYVLHSDMDLTLYGYASLMKGKPDVVVIPNSTEEVSKVVRLAYQEKIPVIGRGSGTNLSGGTVAVKGGIVIHFSRMKRILEIDLPNRTVTVEPGIITLDLQNLLLKQGFVYAPDPASQKVSTLGGNFGRPRRRLRRANAPEEPDLHGRRGRVTGARHRRQRRGGHRDRHRARSGAGAARRRLARLHPYRLRRRCGAGRPASRATSSSHGWRAAGPSICSPRRFPSRRIVPPTSTGLRNVCAGRASRPDCSRRWGGTPLLGRVFDHAGVAPGRSAPRHRHQRAALAAALRRRSSRPAPRSASGATHAPSSA